MTWDERVGTIKAMRIYGGGFVNALAEAWRLADANNSARIESSFADYMEKYGPHSELYAAANKERTP